MTTSHSTFNSMIKHLREAWAELGLTSYKILYEGHYRGGYQLICPEANARREDVDRHLHGAKVRALMWDYWRKAQRYFISLRVASQKYLIKKHKMVEAQ